SRLMGVDEEETLTRLRAIQNELLNPKVAEHRGRIVKTTGDGLLVEFASVVDAARCALDIQHGMRERNSNVLPAKSIEYRIGINVRDVMIQDGDIFGDGVNVAARLEGLCEPGGICIPRATRDQIRDKLGLSFTDLGEHDVKNIARSVRVFALSAPQIEALS